MPTDDCNYPKVCATLYQGAHAQIRICSNKDTAIKATWKPIAINTRDLGNRSFDIGFQINILARLAGDLCVRRTVSYVVEKIDRQRSQMNDLETYSYQRNISNAG